MAKIITQKKITKNVLISIATQIISLVVTFVLYLIVPKLIDELQYSYWQTYILYSANVTILHFGLIDGIALRYSQYDFDEIDKPRLRSQFYILTIIITGFSLLAIIISLFVFGGAAKIIAILVSLSIITKNIILYSSSVLQITNRINKYALLIIIQKLAYVIVVIILLSAGVGNFYWYCIGDLLGDLAAMLISPFINKGMYFGKPIRVAESLKEFKTNAVIGITLLIANYSAVLLTGGAKMIVQWHWDELTFGKVSFAFSVTSLFLVFISAVSIVLFPSLKRLEEESLPTVYKNIRGAISPILFLALLFYFPGCWILNKWLPNYSQSLPYLGLLLPLIVFSSKVSLLTNNYLKVYRKEKTMLIINLVSAAAGIASFVICAYAFNNLTALLISVVVVIMLNSVVSEIFVSKIIRVNLIKDFIVECVMTIGFIVIVKLLDLKYGCLAYAGLFLVYCAVNYKYIFSLFKKLFKRKKNQIPVQENNQEPQQQATDDGQAAEEENLREQDTQEVAEHPESADTESQTEQN